MITKRQLDDARDLARYWESRYRSLEALVNSYARVLEEKQAVEAEFAIIRKGLIHEH